MDGLKGLNADNVSTIVRGIGHITRFMSAMNTSFNPDWAIPNILRDLTTAGIQISDEKKAGLQKALLANWPKALKGSFQHFTKTGSGEWRKVADEFVAEGGKVAWVDFRTVEDFKAVIADEVSTNAMVRAYTGTKKLLATAVAPIEVVNNAVENGIRIAAYKAMIDAGAPKSKAASVARELTVNFNRRGTMQALSAVYMFFNAAVQGNMRLAKSVVKSRFTQRALGGLVMLGFLEALLGAADDEYEKLEEYISERNFVIMLGTGEHVKIPLPYGFNVAKVLGTQIGRMVLHGADPAEAAGRTMGALINSFNPLGADD
ncbi:MAG: LPD38 domain-containing protein, partial [Pseudomonadota bacterium]